MGSEAQKPVWEDELAFIIQTCARCLQNVFWDAKVGAPKENMPMTCPKCQGPFVPLWDRRP